MFVEGFFFLLKKCQSDHCDSTRSISSISKSSSTIKILMIPIPLRNVTWLALEFASFLSVYASVSALVIEKRPLKMKKGRGRKVYPIDILLLIFVLKINVSQWCLDSLLFQVGECCFGQENWEIAKRLPGIFIRWFLYAICFICSKPWSYKQNIVTRQKSVVVSLPVLPVIHKSYQVISIKELWYYLCANSLGSRSRFQSELDDVTLD